MTATEFTEAQVFEGFNTNSKVWIYSSDRLLNENESEEINRQLEIFTTQWTAHDIALKGAGIVLNNRFVVLAVDESRTTASGCSIDKSVHFIKNLETQFDLNLFDRLTIFYQLDNEIKSFHFNDIKGKVASGEISNSTQIYDTTLTNLGLFKNGFIKEAGTSWLAKFL